MSMTASDLVQLSRLLDEALALPPAERQDWLRALAGPDDHLRDTLVQLLAEHDLHEHHDFLHTLPKLGSPAQCDETLPRAGDRIGPYVLLRELGCGGMGTVWLANRVDSGLNRPVALKLPRLAWGAGLGERMARERDIGALLEHPNIARLYDAGLDERGRPYLAMEYIAGQPIDAWCKAQCTSVREKLQLVVQVARAVSHAHARLVVHRDLKPSNVMVTPDGQTHLLDFGIAKRLRDDGGIDSLLSRLMGRAMTPHYASPEQINDEPVTVVSDVYSLGVLLYELLTGSFPHLPGRPSPAALEQRILECDAPPASTRVAERSKARALRGEIDAILAKAMKRQPAQRYGSVDALADDIERHLRGEPVRARPDSLGYRARKLLARHRRGVAAAVLALLAVVAGAAVVTAQSLRAEFFAASAVASARFAAELLALDDGLGQPGVTGPGAVATSIAEAGVGLIDVSLRERPDLRANLYGTVAQVFLDKGRPAMAAHYAARRVELLEQLEATRNERARALLSHALPLLGMDRDADATRALREALALADDPSLQAQLLMARVEADLTHGRLKDADSGLAALEVLVGAENAPADAHRPDVMAYRARWLRLLHGLDTALPLYRAALDLALTRDGPLSARVISMQRKLANALREDHRATEAKALLGTVLASMRRLGGAHAVDAALAESATARLMYAQQDIAFAEALATIEHARSELAALADPPASALAQTARDLGAVYALWGDIARGDALVSQATAALAPGAVGNAARLSLASLAGTVARDAGRHAEAEQWLAQALALRTESHRGGLAGWLASQADWALNLAMQGHRSEAAAALAQAQTAALQKAAADGAMAVWLAPLPGASATTYATISATPSATPSATTPVTPGALDTPDASDTSQSPAPPPGGARTALYLQGWQARLDLLRARLALDDGDPQAALALLAAPAAKGGGSRAATAAPDLRLGERALLQGAALCALGRGPEGLPLLRRQSARLASERYLHDPQLAYWRAVTGLCALQAGELAEALGLAVQAQAAFTAQPGVSEYFKAPSQRLDEQLRAHAQAAPLRTGDPT